MFQREEEQRNVPARGGDICMTRHLSFPHGRSVASVGRIQIWSLKGRNGAWQECYTSPKQHMR